MRRTGDEPRSARSPLRLRLGLAVFGLAWAVVGTVGFAGAEQPGWAIACGVIALVSVVNLTVITHRIRQGPHWQPGRGVPPYRPLRH
jgi:Family of unknown function (DUF6343)